MWTSRDAGATPFTTVRAAAIETVVPTPDYAMPEPGELVESADYAFAFRRIEPVPAPPRALLVLLHGVGGDELQLAALGARAPAGTLVVLPRGFRSISGGKWGWYRVGFGEDGPRIVEDEMQEALGKLIDFLGQLQRHHDVPPARTWLGGFSQGGILAMAAALTSPRSMRRVAMISGRLLAEIEPRTASAEELSQLEVLLVHGREDDVLPVEHAADASDRLHGLGVRHEVRLHDAAHRITPAMADDVACWFEGSMRKVPHPG